jgi:hypothetical protein
MPTRTVLIASVSLAAGVLLAWMTVPVAGRETKAKPFVHVPSTVSAEFQEHLKKLPDPAMRPSFPAPDDVAGWKRFHQEREKALEPKVKQTLKKHGPTVVERKIGGVPVLDIKPKGWKESSKVIV